MFKRQHTASKQTSKAYLGTYTERQRAIRETQRSKPKVTNTYSQQHQTRRTAEPINYDIISTPEYMYQGKWHKGLKEGEGILFTRKGMLIVGNWKRNVLEGRAIVFMPFGGIASVGIRDGKLNGWSIVNFRNKVLACTLYFEDRIDGERLVYQQSEELWVSSKYGKDGNDFIQINQVERGKRNQLPSFVYETELEALLEQFWEDCSFSLVGFNKIHFIKVSADMTYMGYLDENEERPKGLGTIFSKADSFAGNFDEGFLDGYGRILYPNGDIYQGDVRAGALDGFGFFYQSEANSTIVGESVNNEMTNVMEESKGYAAYDIEPRIGRHFKQDFNGVRGKSLTELCQFVEKYYYCYCIEVKEKELYALSNQQQYGASEKDQEFLSRQASRHQSRSPCHNNFKKGIWIDEEQVGQSEEGDPDEDQASNLHLQRVYSLRKRSPTSNTNNNFQSLAVRENSRLEEMERYNKKLPFQDEAPRKSMMGKLSYDEIPSKSIGIEQISFRKHSQNTEQKPAFPESSKMEFRRKQTKKKADPKMQSQNVLLESGYSKLSYNNSGSDNSKTYEHRVDSMLKKTKSKRKRIFD